MKDGVYQGDLMFTKGDVGVKVIGDEKCYTFQPNTILYAVPVNSGLGAQIAKAKIGIVNPRVIIKVKAINIVLKSILSFLPN